MTNSKEQPTTEMTNEEKEEMEHFRKVISSVKSYKRDSETRLARSHTNLKRIPLEHQRLLITHGFKSGLEDLQSCIELNDIVLSEMISDASTMFENSSSYSENSNDVGADGDGSKTSQMEIEKIQSTLKQFVRDWSDVGKEERKMSYTPIMNELEKLYPRLEGNSDDSGLDSTSRPDKLRNKIKVLVPGSGLGRLAYDIAKRGFECQGNEFSLYMLIASNYVLNRCKTRNCKEIYPWIHQFTNNIKMGDMLASVKFPDVDPADISEDAQFSMVAGDFLEVYNAPEYENSKDVVVTSFFLDTAHNVLDYIELIQKILKPKGHWINLGPLLYHFAENPREPSIEPPYDIVRSLITLSGFEFIRESTDHQAKYCQNPNSMLQYTYNCVFFTCVKKGP